MINWLYVLVLIVVVVIWLLLKRFKANSSSTHKSASVTSKRKKEFGAVSIKTGPRACSAAKYLRGKRFISSQAPALPLSKCDISDCKCKYQYYTDRRSEDDRRYPSAIMQSIFTDKNKREKSKVGRRKK
ncbi:MAG: hypothetical protein ACERLB_03815 [Gammaproteobacteria bacterium]